MVVTRPRTGRALVTVTRTLSPLGGVWEALTCPTNSAGCGVLFASSSARCVARAGVHGRGSGVAAFASAASTRRSPRRRRRRGWSSGPGARRSIRRSAARPFCVPASTRTGSAAGRWAACIARRWRFTGAQCGSAPKACWTRPERRRRRDVVPRLRRGGEGVPAAGAPECRPPGEPRRRAGALLQPMPVPDGNGARGAPGAGARSGAVLELRLSAGGVR